MPDSGATESEYNVGLAFLLVTMAGSATAVGGSVVFFPKLVQQENHIFLAGSLAFASGVMIFLSFADLLEESREEFEEAGYDDANVTLYVMLSLFAGFATVILLDFVVHRFIGNGDHDGHGHHHGGNKPAVPDNKQQSPSEPLIRSSDSPEDNPEGGGSKQSLLDHQHMHQMGVKVAGAVFIHNFPEGLAVFIAALTDLKSGVALAIAVGLHNIPEGLVVAIPVFYGTGNRLSAFAAAATSGGAQIIGGALGYLFLKDTITDTVFGMLYGWIAGIISLIAFRELLPAARNHDPDDKVTTVCLVGGIIFMASVLVLLGFLL